MQDLLAGKVAIVTGAAGGIGAGHARAIAEAGARVIVADLDVEHGEATAATLRADGLEALFAKVDISDTNSVDDLGKMVVSRVQLIDGITRTLTCPVVHLN